MLEQVLSSTKIISAEHLAAEELDRLILYCGGPQANVAVIEDNRPFDTRDRMLEQLSRLREVTRLNRVFPDPKVGDIMEMVAELEGKRIDLIIGIGGGSTMDSAKGVAAVLSNGGDLGDYLGASASKKIERKDVRLILIPTTAGTGAEVTKFGVYTSRSGRKYTLNNPLLQADAAVLVAEYTYNLPPALTAATTFDALSHALEALWNRNATPVSDAAAINSAVHILKCMETAYDNPVAGRAEMLGGACMAGIAFNMTGTAAVHAISFILSEEWHIPHGAACAFSLEDIMRLNMQDRPTRRKLAAIAAELFGQAGEDALVDDLYARIIKLKRKFGLPFTFKDIGVGLQPEELESLFRKSLDDPKMSNNIMPVDMDTVKRIIADKCRS